MRHVSVNHLTLTMSTKVHLHFNMITQFLQISIPYLVKKELLSLEQIKTFKYIAINFLLFTNPLKRISICLNNVIFIIAYKIDKMSPMI